MCYRPGCISSPLTLRGVGQVSGRKLGSSEGQMVKPRGISGKEQRCTAACELTHWSVTAADSLILISRDSDQAPPTLPTSTQCITCNTRT